MQAHRGAVRLGSAEQDETQGKGRAVEPRDNSRVDGWGLATSGERAHLHDWHTGAVRHTHGSPCWRRQPLSHRGSAGLDSCLLAVHEREGARGTQQVGG